MRRFLDIARHGLWDVFLNPGLVLVLYGANLLASSALWALASVWLEPLLAGRPEPDPWGWLVIQQTHPRLLARLLLASGGVGLGYLLLGTLLAGGALTRLRTGAGLWRGALRHLWALLRLRLLVWMVLAALITAGVMAAPELYERSLSLDTDWLPAAIQLLLLLLGLPALAALLMMHLGQARVVLGDGPVRALRQALALLHRRPGLCLWLYISAWLAWAGITAAFGTAQVNSLVPAQAATLLRVAVHLWSYSTALRIVESDRRG